MTSFTDPRPIKKEDKAAVIGKVGPNNIKTLKNGIPSAI